MGFRENILELTTLLNQSKERHQGLVAYAHALINSMDWGEFQRADILPFINEHPCKQHYGPYQFGQFNLTLAHHEHFSVQIYFMEGVPTEIHSHAFHGYFHYLQGNVLQTKFKAMAGEKITDKVYAKTIEVESEKILYTGEGEIITPGPVHQIIRLGDVSTVLMVMAYPFEKRASELILPSGHLIKAHSPSEEFLRFITLLAATPELKAQILPKLKIEDLLLYCFRNSQINTSSSVGLINTLYEELNKYLNVDEILDAFSLLAKKQLKFKAIGKG